MKTDFVFGIQDPVILGENNEPEPDISILKFRADYYASSHPQSVDILGLIEVAGTSIKYDHEVKTPLYASYSIPFYWIIDIENQRIEVLSKPSSDTYLEKKTYDEGQEISLLDLSFQVTDFLP